MKKLLLSALACLSITFIVSNHTVNAQVNGNTSLMEDECLNAKVIELKYEMQKLWIEYAWWTRSLIVSALADLDDKEDVLERLLQNQVDIGNLIKPYYGQEAGNHLTTLLKEHIIIAGKLLDAIQNKKNELVQNLNKEWIDNADEIVSFLSNANPNWSPKELTDMFYKHLELTTDEVEARINNKWVEDIKAADQNEEHLIHMGDFLTEGIVKQFQKKFKVEK